MTDFGEHFESLLGMRARVCVCVKAVQHMEDSNHGLPAALNPKP